MNNPFQFLNDITFDKKNSLVSKPELEKEYNPFLINRGLSQYKDCVFAANEMNQVVPKVKRWGGKWAKRIDSENIKIIHDTYGCSWSQAEEYSKILNNIDIQRLKEQTVVGGVEE